MENNPNFNSTSSSSYRKSSSRREKDLQLLEQLDYYELNYNQSDIEEVKKRVNYIQENILSIQRLLLEFPNRWPNICKTVEIFKKRAKNDWDENKTLRIYHDLSDSEKEELKNSLISTSLRLSKLKVPLPSPIFNSIYRFIENKDFEYLLDKKSISYLLILTEKEDPPLNWDKDLYIFLRKYLRTELLK